MKYHSMSESWDRGAENKFLYTNLIFQDGDDYFTAQVPDRVSNPAEIDLPNELTKIPNEHLWPLHEDDLTICSFSDSPDVYIKQPSMSSYSGSPDLSKNLLKEAKICEVLIKNPHENIARYHGCVVKDGRITGLCFEKYAQQLMDRQNTEHQVDIDSCCHQIEAGLKHLHFLNLVHNDIRDSNVMFKTKHGEEVVIIDFDACAIQGLPIEGKSGPIPEGAHMMEFSNDDYALKVLRKRLQVAKDKTAPCPCEGCLPPDKLLSSF
ncbi:hypothetical protein N7490_001641 [Penicillium lividum]|nr:hypothetical protein N7490_001641 [Penicillium lividum]